MSEHQATPEQEPNLLVRILHAITPFHYSYSKWSDTIECNTFWEEERQQRFCRVCNKKQYRTVNNFTLGG